MVVAISGALATGKTELLHRFAEETILAGVPFIMASGSAAEQALPFGVSRQMFRSATPASSAAMRLAFVPEGGAGTIGTWGEVASAGTSTIGMVSRLGTALLELAELDALVVAVDDVNYADLASLDLLLYLARRVRASRMLVITTQGGPADKRFEAEFLSQPHCTRVKLGLLSTDGVASMVSEDLGPDSAARLSHAYHAVTGGNPLLVRALIRDQLAAHGFGRAAVADAPVVGLAYEEAVLRCLYRSTPDMLQAARVSAILRESASSSLRDDLMSMDPGQADLATRALTEAGLFHQGQFRHQAALNVTLRSLSRDEQDALHRYAARLLFEAGATAAAVARHLVAVGQVREAWESDILHEAAEQALSDGKPDFAIACLRLVLQSSDTEPQRLTTQVLLAHAEWRVNPLAAGRRLSEVTDAIGAGDLSGRLRVRSIMLLLWCGRLAEATRALDQMAHDDDSDDDSGLQELNAVSGWLAYAHPPLRTRVPPLPASGKAADPKSAVGGPRLETTHVLASALNGGPASRSGRAGTRLLATADQILRRTQPGDHSMSAILAAILATIYGDKPEKAAPWSEALPGRLPGLAPTWRALLSWVRAKISVHMGDLPAAEKLAVAALSEMSPQNWGIAIGDPLAVLIYASTAMGKLAEAEGYLSRPVPEAMFESVSGLQYLHAQGRYQLAAGRPAAALGSFQACGDLMSRWQIDRPTIVPWRSEAARALLQMGDKRSARDLATAQMNMLDQDNSRTRGISLRVCGLASDLGQRRNLLQQAVDLLRASGDRLELAYALTDLSQTYYALGESNRARLTRRRAHQLAMECQVQPLFELLQPEPSTEVATLASGSPAAADRDHALSEAEHRVAILAVQGHTNREIASKLFVTVSTVEQHLTSIYRKLRIRRRRDLPTTLYPQAAESASG